MFWPTVTQEDITVGIVTKNRWDTCLFSLVHLFQYAGYFKEIRLIDNNYRSPTSALIAISDLYEAEKVNFEVVHMPYAYSIYELRQLLLEGVKTKYLMILDDDVILLDAGLLKYVHDKIDEDFGFLQGSKIDYKNDMGYRDWAFEKDSIIYQEGIPLWYYYYNEESWVSTVHLDTGYCLIDVAKALEVGGFTCEDSFTANEDVLLGARLASRYPCFYCSYSRAIHVPRPRYVFGDRNPLELLEKARGISEDIREKLRRFYEARFQKS